MRLFSARCQRSFRKKKKNKDEVIEKRREIDKKRCLGKVMKEMDARKIVKVERSPEKVI